MQTNDKQSANQFEMEVVQRQVQALQVVPTVHLMAAGKYLTSLCHFNQSFKN